MPGQLAAGEYFVLGDYACAEGAIAAGCRFFAGYPITPATEIAERMSRRLPLVGGHYIQMEDEIASIAAVLGASNAGVKSMTATSGPGFSLMLENIGLGMMIETPCVIVDVQRGGPSTGLPTLVGQGDMMQARWGSHGDYEVIAYVPSSVQEMFNLTIKAFNASERFRMPVLVLADQVIGHMTGKLLVPPPEAIDIKNRVPPAVAPGEHFLPFDFSQEVPPMACAGAGYSIHVTGLTHDERGYPSSSEEAEHKLIDHIVGKVRNHVRDISEFEKFQTDDAAVLVVAFGAVARSARQAVKQARQLGIKAGLFRLITAWPFPEEALIETSRSARVIVVPEINYGQMVHVVREFAECRVRGLPHAAGSLPRPEEILKAIVEAS